MTGVNEALRILKTGLDLEDAQPTYTQTSKNGVYAAITGSNHYFPFRPLKVYFNADGEFELTIYSNEGKFFIDDNPLCSDTLGFRRYIKMEEQAKLLKSIRRKYNALLKSSKKIIQPFKNEVDNLWLNSLSKLNEIHLRAENALDSEKEVKELMERLCNLISGKYSLEENLSIEIVASSDKLYIHNPEIMKVSEPCWKLHSTLIATIPCQIDEEHPLVSGISNNPHSYEFFMPVNVPEIVVKVKRERPSGSYFYSSYEIQVKDSGVDEKTLGKMMELLLI